MGAEGPVVRRSGPFRSLGRLAVGTAIALALAASILVSPAVASATAPATWASVPSQWGNGLVLCTFSSSQPSVAVSAESLNGTGLGTGVAEVQEVSLSGAVVASAAFPSANWSQVNNSHDSWFDMTYTSQVPVTGAAGSSGTLGVRVDFVLPAYAETPGQNLSAVNFTLSLSNWPWQQPNDRLRATLPVWTAFPAAEYLVAGTGTGPIVTALSTATGQPREYVIVPSAATTGNGTVSASSSLVLSGASGTVAVTFGSEAGQFSSLNYSTHVGIILPRTVAGIPIYDFVAVGGVGAAVVLAVAVVTRRLRHAPSDLEFVEDE
jgi:hypothetical protein